MSPLRSLLLCATLTTALLVSVSCDTTVDVFRPPEPTPHSIYGWLDVAADTQTFRVTPIGDSDPLGSPPELDVTLHLENLDTDTTVTLRDSFVTVNPSSHRDPTKVHTFWTTYPIDLATSYELSLRRRGETTASVTTTTPLQKPELSHDNGFIHGCVSNRSRPFFRVFIREARTIAAAHVRYPVEPTEYNQEIDSTTTFDILDTVRETDDGFVLTVNYFEHGVCYGYQFLRPDKQYAEVTVAVGGPDWPKWRNASLNDLGRVDTFSNVNDGYGFASSTYTDTIRVPFQ